MVFVGIYPLRGKAQGSGPTGFDIAFNELFLVRHRYYHVVKSANRVTTGTCTPD